MTENRIPSGVPTGGQFAASQRTEIDLSLAPSPDAEPASVAALADLRASQERLRALQQEVAERAAYAAALLVTERFPDAEHLVLAPAEDAGWETYPAVALDENGAEVHDFEADHSNLDTCALQMVVMDLPARDYRALPGEPYADIDDAYTLDLRAILDNPPPPEPTPDYPRARNTVTPALARVFDAEIANERNGGVSPATVDSTIDSIVQGLPTEDYGLDHGQALALLLTVRDAVPGDTPVIDLID